MSSEPDPAREPRRYAPVVASLSALEQAAARADDNALRTALTQFRQAAVESGLFAPFPWHEWQEQARRYVDQPDLIDRAALDSLSKLVTFHIRQDRFMESHLEAMVRNGHLQRIVRRIEVLTRDQQARGATE